MAVPVGLRAPDLLPRLFFPRDVRVQRGVLVLALIGEASGKTACFLLLCPAI